MYKKHWSVTFAIIIVLFVVGTTLLFTYTIINIRHEQKLRTKELKTKLNVYSNQLDNALAIPIWNYDAEQISEIVISSMSDPEVQSIHIFEANNPKYSIAWGRGQNNKIVKCNQSSDYKNVISGKTPIYYNKKLIGYVQVFISRKYMEEDLAWKKKYLVLLSLILEVSFICGIFLLLWLLIIKPIKQIEKYAVAVSSGENIYKIQSTEKYYGELDILNNAITNMVSVLNTRYITLQEAEQKYRDLFEKSPVAIWEEDISAIISYFDNLRQSGITDLAKYFKENPNEPYKCISSIKVLRVNKASVILHNAKSEQELIKNLHLTFTEESFHIFINGLISIFNNENEYESEATIKAITGELKHIIIKWAKTYNTKSTTILLVTMGDISSLKAFEEKLLENEKELKLKNEEYLAINEELTESNQRIIKINEELQLAKEKAEESDKLKSAFLSNMSHEIRTPMNAIIGFSDLMVNKQLSEETRANYLTILNNSCNQLLHIVNDILDISKVEAGIVQLINEDVDVTKMLSEIYLFQKPLALKKNIDFKFNNKINNIHILIDRTKLIQILNNLLNNAFKFTKRGYVELGCYLKETTLVFYVEDSGIGISEQMQSMVFDRFRQVETAINKVPGGTGLGLSIVKAYAKLLGGNINLKSEPSKGSRFSFELPYNPSTQEDVLNIENTTLHDFHQMKKILVVEDDEFNYQYLKEVLEQLGCEHIRTIYGKEAIDICKNTDNLELVIMDIKLPDLNGLEAVKQIRLFNKNLPIVALSAYAYSNDKQDALEAGCNEYMTKPVKQTDLFAMLKKYS